MRQLFSFLLVIALTACSPPLDWREVQGGNAPFSVLMPAKPSRFTRAVDLDGLQVEMSMTAAEAEDIIFAVGVATLTDPSQSTHALDAMKRAMVNNIGGTIQPKPADDAIDLAATGTANGKSAFLYGRFVAKEKWAYQAIVIARGKAAAPETLETFFHSFELR